MIIDDNLKIIKLIDAYGKLLTDRQYDMMTFYYFDNLSLSEIAYNYDVSRQAVSDCINKSIKILSNLEEKLQVVANNEVVIEKLSNIRENLSDDNLMKKMDEVLNLLK
ncbi:MAG: transcriptional regulator [Clostridiales bacterium]|nr:transcriptional regulator [Clostridiales bacterium]